MNRALKGYIAIGDIHGCSATLETLLARLDAEYGAERTYVFLGDYVDRGPNSKQVIDLLLKFSESHNCEFIRGNHDQMLLNYYADNTYYEYLNYGGAVTLESYYSQCPDRKIPFAHLKFLIGTKLFVEADHWVFVHGGLPPKVSVREALDDTAWHDSFLWNRDHLENEENEWEKTVVFGHTPVRQPIQKNNMIGIDTGCVYPQFGKLTAVVLPELEFVQQKRID
jgi:serine/threonine protein phosphatase 1